jgi:hypothetical protein
MGKVTLSEAQSRITIMMDLPMSQYRATQIRNQHLLQFVCSSLLGLGEDGYVCDCIKALPNPAEKRRLWMLWRQFLVRWVKYLNSLDHTVSSSTQDW